MKKFALVVLLWTSAAPVAAWADTCSSHNSACQTMCAQKGDLRGRCASTCQQRVETCKQTGVYTDGQGQGHSVTSRE
jgi:hypothetical protein